MKIRLPFFNSGLEIKASFFSETTPELGSRKSPMEIEAISAATQKAWRGLIEQWDVAPESVPPILTTVIKHVLEASALAILDGEDNPLTAQVSGRTWNALATRISSPRAQNESDRFFKARKAISDSDRPLSNAHGYIRANGEFSHVFDDILRRMSFLFLVQATEPLAKSIEEAMLDLAAKRPDPNKPRRQPRL